MQKYYSCFFNVFRGTFGVLIIPKWLINDSWSIAILCGTFLDRPNMWPNLDPRSPYLLPTYFTNYKQNMGTSVNLWNFSYLRICTFENMKCFERPICVFRFVVCILFENEYLVFNFVLCRWGSKRDTICINEISKSSDMNFRSIKKHEMVIW